MDDIVVCFCEGLLLMMGFGLEPVFYCGCW